MTRTIYLTLACTALAGALANAGCTQETVPRYATPEDVFAACNHAALHDDPKTYLNCLTTEAIHEQAHMCMFASQWIVAAAEKSDKADDKKAAKKLKPILEKYGIPATGVKLELTFKFNLGPAPAKATPRSAEEQWKVARAKFDKLVFDRKAYLLEILPVIWSFIPGIGSFGEKAKLGDVVVSEDKATATVWVEGQPGVIVGSPTPMSFAKVDGGWRIAQFRQPPADAPAEKSNESLEEQVKALHTQVGKLEERISKLEEGAQEK